jgi:hypothetical protein
LIISDITGYSLYLNESELEHAQDSLTDLLNILVEHTKSPLVISKLEGDAVFSYVKKGGILQSQTLLEIIENTYAAFRKALDLMIINTTCTCNACRNLPNLDLKFFVHYGEFSTQKIGSYTELVGNDVNLIHRLLKNTVTEHLETSAYALYTQAVLEVLPETSVFESFTSHEENYPHLGSVKVVVQDMHDVWDKKKNQIRVVVHKEDALVVKEFDYTVPPLILWEYITKPEYRSLLLDSDSQQFDNRKGGRVGASTKYICAHGNRTLIQTIVDWQPFEQYTIRDIPPLPGVTTDSTFRIYPTDSGSRLAIYWGKANGNWMFKTLSDFILKNIISKNFPSYMEALNQKILKDLEMGNTLFEQPIKIEPIVISSAAEDALKLQE